MTVKANTLTVQPPIPQKHLSRHRDDKGVYLIRLDNTVLYIGASDNIYKAAMRLFQRGGKLNHFNYNRLNFEIVYTSLRSPAVEDVLKRHFRPQYNKRIRKLIKANSHMKRQSKRILTGYLAQSRFGAAQGEHKTDSKPYNPKTNDSYN